MLVGRIKDPVFADGILQRGSADYCIMTRALMADPEMPNKVMTGRLDDVRPCLTCMQGCTDRTWAQLDLSCLINPAAGREIEWDPIKPADHKKRVLVVGAGPAGMETARVASLRGHDVTLWEQSEQLGGTALLAALPPFRSEMGDLTRWLSDQITKAGVKIETNKRAEKESIISFQPDVLVAAAGALPEIPRHIPGWNLPHVTHIYDVLSGKSSVGQRILIVGYTTPALECADWLAEQEKTVYLISGYPTQAWEDPTSCLANDKNGFTGRYAMIDRILEQIEFLPSKMVKEITPDAVILSKTGEQHPCTTHVRMGDLEDQRLEVDTVIIHLRMRPLRSWLDGVEDIVSEIHEIGDCLEPRKAIDAMADAGALARKI